MPIDEHTKAVDAANKAGLVPYHGWDKKHYPVRIGSEARFRGNGIKLVSRIWDGAAWKLKRYADRLNARRKAKLLDRVFTEAAAEMHKRMEADAPFSRAEARKALAEWAARGGK